MPAAPETPKIYHAFVAMPFGTKEGIDFNRVYGDLIKPALSSAGFEVFRADEERRAGNIRTDMFQELLVADLVVADLSIDNPNVWYELGVRHALRARGVIQIQAKRDYLPFDVYTDRSLRYHLSAEGVPDPAYLEADRNAVATFARETIESWYGRKISPVYHLLPFLEEPNWKKLRVETAKEFWEAQDTWERQIEVSRKAGRPGDIVLLAGEAPARALRLEALWAAAGALISLGKFAMALDQLEEALQVDPQDLVSIRKKGLVLGRLSRFDEAAEWTKGALEKYPADSELWALLGRIEKEAWIASWRKPEASQEQMREEAAFEDARLREAIEHYRSGFEQSPTDFYPGINCISLMHLHRHLTGEDPAPDVRRAMEGGVRWAALSLLGKEPKDYWARATLAELEVLIGDRPSILRAYKEAVVVAEKDWFKLDSSRQQLLLLRDLQFRPEEVGEALRVVEKAISQLRPPEGRWEPRQVFLFSGHMIDKRDRPKPRFPADKEGIARQAIERKLDELGAGPEDLALCGGACGGDLLFAEAALTRSLKLEMRLPFDEPAFLTGSVTFAGDKWRDLYYTVKAHPNTRVLVLPAELGKGPRNSNAYARNNLWQLYSALAWGADKLRFLCLWNRLGGDGPGGTQHMHDVVIAKAGRVYVLDTNELFALAGV